MTINPLQPGQPAILQLWSKLSTGFHPDDRTSYIGLTSSVSSARISPASSNKISNFRDTEILSAVLVGKAVSLLRTANDNWTIENTEEDTVGNKKYM